MNIIDKYSKLIRRQNSLAICGVIPRETAHRNSARLVAWAIKRMNRNIKFLKSINLFSEEYLTSLSFREAEKLKDEYISKK